MILAWISGRKELYGWMKDVSLGKCYYAFVLPWVIDCMCVYVQYMEYRQVCVCVHVGVYGIIKITALVSINVHNSTALLIFTTPFLDYYYYTHN